MGIPSEAEHEPFHAADPFRLRFLHALFELADEEHDGRRGLPRADEGSVADGEVAHLTASLRSHLQGLSPPGLRRLRTELARSFLVEVDRRLAADGAPPGERVRLDLMAAAMACEPAEPAGARVALVSLPWMSPAMPSIQLATLAAALRAEDIAVDVHELYVDYAARIGLNLYNDLCNLLGYLPEWVFTRHYYRAEQGDDLSGMLAERPLDQIPWPELGDVILRALDPVTEEYLDDMLAGTDWSHYDVVGCSLTISQLGASMAFVRRLKQRHPRVRVVFGGSQCAGPMGRAILAICPYVDVVVHIEGELVLAEIVRRLRAGASLQGLRGVSHRGPAGDDLVTGPPGELFRPGKTLLPLCYDAYFLRLGRLGLLDKLNPWLPFEGSRGCWYGQKNQCTFCGLHEIMEFRVREADLVLAELERLHARYGIGRFYSMDLILPRDFFQTLLPAIARSHPDWMIFYEVKANMRREEVELLAAAGVRWIQPGIESLDTELLRLMKKGVSSLQNIQLLKWCRELGIFCGWNLLSGLPGESQEAYARLAELIPKLFHLKPPSGGGRFQLHRFSPYFDHPADYGIRWTGAHPMYRHAFPVPPEVLNDLVYLHDFTLESGAAVDSSAVEAAVRAWHGAERAGASLHIHVRPDGSSVIVDSRTIGAPVRRHRLGTAATELYLFLDAGVGERTLADAFSRAHPRAAEQLAKRGGLEPLLVRWLEHALVLAIDGKLVSLALYPSRPRAAAPEVSVPARTDGLYSISKVAGPASRRN
ncbi:MAG TPA: RiPP maturation radical SAM C-methyltransferase [Longimicrobium sp.]